MPLDFVTNDEIVQAARRRLHQGAWDYATGGAESETTLRRNRAAFDKIAFRPRILVDVSHVDPSTTFLGHQMRIPAMLAPIGSLQVFDPSAAVGCAEAAAQFGTIEVVSTVTDPELEVTAASTTAPKFFQLYVQGDITWVESLLGRVRAAGYAGLALTVDVAHYSRRERVMVDRWSVPTQLRPDRARERRYGSELTWELMDTIKQIWGDRPFMLKGVQTAEDAELAVQHGVDVLWVSNHGGRQIDHALGSLDSLPEIVQAAAGRARIILDGGVQRGSDIVKALALGADAVALGKLQAWALAAAGAAGVVRMLEILEDEMVCQMALIGVTSVSQLCASYVTKADLVTMPHEMSAWVNIPGGQIK
jgi:isopentenyl diphosphate isomerase/L-lactate dehydrogenase-like FMN-dependent dehydrogenase